MEKEKKIKEYVVTVSRKGERKVLQKYNIEAENEEEAEENFHLGDIIDEEILEDDGEYNIKKVELNENTKNENKEIVCNYPIYLEEISEKRIKNIRVKLDEYIQELEKKHVNILGSLEPKVEVLKNLTLARMWLGKCLEAKGKALPREYADKSE